MKSQAKSPARVAVIVSLCSVCCFSRLRPLCRLQRIQGHMVSKPAHVTKWCSYATFTVTSVLSCRLYFGSDVKSGRTGGSSGENGLCRRDHHKQTQSPECPQPHHDPTDLPSAQSTRKCNLRLGQMSADCVRYCP